VHVQTFHALADPVRLHIVDVLRAGEQSVNDIVDTVEIDQSGVSRHLRILHQGGFVDVRPDGQRRMYSLRPEPFLELDAWIGEYRRLWTARLDRFGDALQRKHATRIPRRKERKKR
jgi:DNA-binding transcriptional ArsR family regulator